MASTRAVGNRILDALPKNEMALLLPDLKHETLKHEQSIYDSEAPLKRMYFPMGAVISMVISMQDGSTVEVGTVGREGMSGIQILLGEDRIPGRGMCQVPGEAQSLSVKAFRSIVKRSPTLDSLTRRYAQSVYNVMAQSVACNRLHTINERCARWLLTARDRAGRNEIELTQEFLAMMLGVARPGVSVAAGALQQAGFIRYSRGRVRIADLRGLESASCECYQISAEALEKIFRK